MNRFYRIVSLILVIFFVLVFILPVIISQI